MERPVEPLLAPKGERGEVVFDTPRDSWPEDYQNIDSDDLNNRFGPSSSVSAITVKEIKLPDLNLSKELSRDEIFYTFIPYHRKMASELINVFLEMPTYEDFVTAAALVRDVINPGMWTFAMQVALTNRNDTQNIDCPPLTALMPQKFIERSAFSQARQQVSLLREDDRMPIEIPRDYTASDLDPEHRIAYFREDMGINLHHWTWHLVYPFAGTPEIVNKDRRGELFYYQHQQIIARYNAERLSNKLLRVEPFNNFFEPIKEAYFPKLDTLVASRNWPSRMANSKLQDVKRVAERLVFDIHQLEIWRDRILQAAQEGRALRSNYSYVNLVNTQGIDVLGDIMESSARNINPNLYGDLHNLGHVAFAIVHDPDQRYLEQFGVVGDLATSMRDPIFYRWHKYIDEIFQQHKATLQPYTEQELGFSGINVTSVEVRAQGYPTNELHTFWQQSDVDLSRGLDIAPQGTVYARLNHLQHAPFTYRIQVQNNGQQRRGTVRIFMAPKFDERGIPMIFSEQRLLFIEMDKFTVNLRSGNNTIERRSTQSSITIPYERTFRPLDQTRVTPTDQEYNYCGCGWPQHMLIPKGSPEGFPVELFVMVSNYEDDRVDQPPPTGCKSGVSYCGLRNQKYPDRRPMGFPFDRNNQPGTETVRQFRRPNMFLTDVKIYFKDRIEIRVTRNGTQITQNTTSRP
ncbi:phenoloxidase 1 isoform X2 [Anabrus simplex]